MSTKQINLEDMNGYIDNLLYNHDIELLSQFIKDMSFEKQDDFAFFTEFNQSAFSGK